MTAPGSCPVLKKTKKLLIFYHSIAVREAFDGAAADPAGTDANEHFILAYVRNQHVRP